MTQKFKLTLLIFSTLLIIGGFLSFTPKKEKSNNDYIVAAYVWPSTHADARGRDMLWSEGIGEWEMIRKGDSRFPGHYQPKSPLWGYKMGDDPKFMENRINVAADHGVNTFIFDWYWYDGGPFLEAEVNAFVKAPNTNRMKFYIMWANHDVPGSMWNYFRYKTDSIIWNGEIDWPNYKIVVDRVINQYFKQANYLKIDNKPVFNIFSVDDLINSFGSIEETKKALDYLRDEVKKAGFEGLHLQVCGRRIQNKPTLVIENVKMEKNTNDLIDYLGINSITHYNWKMLSGLNEDYIKWGDNAQKFFNKLDSMTTIPVFPVVTIGWDDTPRKPKLGMESVCHINNTPESFAAYLQKAKDYCDKHPEQAKMIVVNAWNEYIEGSYLEPDMKRGYSYLEAVQRVMSGKYDKYNLQPAKQPNQKK